MPRLIGAPAVASSGDGLLEVFVFTVDGALWHIGETQPGNLEVSWSEWTRLGGPWPGGSWPAVVAPSGDGRLELFVATANGLQHAWQTAWSNGWSGWVAHDPPPPIPGAGIAGPGLAANADGRLELFVANGQLWRLEQTAWSNGWSTWLPHGAPPGSLLTGPPAAARSADGRIEVFVVDTRGSIWNIHQTQAAGPWSGWNAFGSAGGGLDGRPALGRHPDGRLRLFARANDGGLWQRGQAQVSATTTWSDWSLIDTGVPHVALSDHPVAVNAGTDWLEVFITGADRHVWNAQNLPTRTDWQFFPMESSQFSFGPAAPAAGLNRLGELKVLVVGLDGNLWTATLYIGVPGPNSQSMFTSLGQPSEPTVPTIVPDVRELRVPAAKAAVEQAHLVAKFTGASSGNPWVSTQSPAAGTTVERGSTVTMQLRTGPIL